MLPLDSDSKGMLGGDCGLVAADMGDDDGVTDSGEDGVGDGGGKGDGGPCLSRCELMRDWWTAFSQVTHRV